MKKVLNHGIYYREPIDLLEPQYIVRVCQNCGCRFAYTQEEVIQNPSAYYPDYMVNTVICPECGDNIRYSTLRVTQPHTREQIENM